MMDIPQITKLQLIEQELAMYRNSAYILSVRHRVNKKLGQTAEQLKAIEDDMVKTEQAIDELEKIKAELTPSATPVK